MNDIATLNQKLTIAEKAKIFTQAEMANPEKTIEILVNAGIIEPKVWYQSIGTSSSAGGMVGSAAVLIVGIAKAFGWEIDIGATAVMIGAAVALAGYTLSWWGRVGAVQPISRTQVTPGITLHGRNIQYEPNAHK